MSLLKRSIPVDIDRLEQEIRGGTNQVLEYAPPQHCSSGSAGPEVIAYLPLQVIGHAITKLTWKDAEKMGEAIQAKMKDGITLTSAIQAWASEWESFSD